MKKYLYAVCRNKQSISRYFVNHCVIVDCKTELCYHCTRNGYGAYYAAVNLYELTGNNRSTQEAFRLAKNYIDKTVETFR